MTTAVRNTKLNAGLQIMAAHIDSFPITAKEIVDIAEELGVNREFIDFYKDFPETRKFKSLDELVATTEEVETFNEDLNEQPDEELRSPEM